MPEIPRDDNVKSLPPELANEILVMANEHFPGVPVYFKSSCALTNMLKRPSIVSVQAFARRDCELSRCPLDQRQICSQGGVFKLTPEQIQQKLDKLGIPATAIGWDLENGVETDPDFQTFSYALRQSLIKQVALEG